MDIIDNNTPRNEFGVPTSIPSIGLDENGNVVDISKYIRAAGYNGEATGNAFYSRIDPTDKILGGYIWDDFDLSGRYSLRIIQRMRLKDSFMILKVRNYIHLIETDSNLYLMIII